MAIKLGGKSASTPAPPKPKRSPAKAKPARSTGRSTAKATPKRKATATATPTSNRRPTTDDPKVIKQYTAEMKKVGKRYQAARQEHADATNAVYEMASEAMDAGVPTGVITDTLGLSRQWLYKMKDHQGRSGNGNGSGSKAAAKSAVQSAKRPARRSSKPSSSGNRIRIRS